MNWQHLMYFLEAAKQQNFRIAADNLYINTSTLSKAIASIEEELDLPLFKKNGRNVQLTKYGKIYLDYVSLAQKDLTLGQNVLHSLAEKESGTVNIGSIFSVGAYYIPKFLKIFQQSYPNIKINLSQQTTQQILESILDNDIDIGLCGEFDLDDFQGIAREKIFNEEIVLIVYEGHSLYEKNEVTYQEIRNETFIGYNDLTGLRINIYEAIRKREHSDFELKTVYKSNEDNSVIGLVRAGLGIAFIVDTPHIDLQGLKKIKLSDLYVVRNIYLIWNNTHEIYGGTKILKNQLLNTAIDNTY